MLSKVNPLRYIANGSKNPKHKKNGNVLSSLLMLGSMYLAIGQKIHLYNFLFFFFLSCLYLFDSIFPLMAWIDELHDCSEIILFP